MCGLMRLVPGGVIVPTAVEEAVLVDAAFETAIIFCTTIGAFDCDVVTKFVFAPTGAADVIMNFCVWCCCWKIKSPALMLQICFFIGTECCCSVGEMRLLPAGTADALRIIVLFRLTLMCCVGCDCCVCSKDIRGICAFVSAGSVVFVIFGATAIVACVAMGETLLIMLAV